MNTREAPSVPLCGDLYFIIIEDQPVWMQVELGSLRRRVTSGSYLRFS